MKHQLPALPYDTSALEPHIDTRTLTVHHDMHHAAYVKALNEALESAPEALQEKSPEWLLLNLNKLPGAIRTAVKHNAGGHLNHSLLWQSMSPHGGVYPCGALADAIDASFGSVGKLRTQFDAAGAKLFGSGWVWLVRTRDDDVPLGIVTTTGHDNPLLDGLHPLLVNDVWEHAYYLKYENRRPEYLKAWWTVVNWKEVARRFESAGQTAPRGSKADTDALLEAAT